MEDEMKIKKHGSLEELKTKEEKMHDRFQKYIEAIKKRDEKILKCISEIEEILNNQPHSREECNIRSLISEIKKNLQW